MGVPFRRPRDSRHGEVITAHGRVRALTGLINEGMDLESRGHATVSSDNAWARTFSSTTTSRSTSLSLKRKSGPVGA